MHSSQPHLQALVDNLQIKLVDRALAGNLQNILVVVMGSLRTKAPVRTEALHFCWVLMPLAT